MNVHRQGRARFGPFVLDLATGELRKYDIKISLQSQPFEVLLALLEHPSELVTREELKQRIWGDATYVDFDQGLNRAVKKIRAALTDSADEPKYVETLAKRGYRFIGSVSFDPQASTAAPPVSDLTPRQFVLKKWLKPAIGAGVALATTALLCVFWTRNQPVKESRGKLQQLTKNAAENSLVNAVISPDGNYLLFGDLAGIHLRLISTQETQTFSSPEGTSARDGSFPVSWFPDQSKFVAVSIASGSDGFRVKSWIVSVLGGAITPLRENAFACSVSPDGSLITFTTGGPFLDQEIWITGPHGEDARQVGTLKGQGQFGDVQWAPDGRHIADMGKSFSTGGSQFFLESRDLKGSTPTRVLSQEQPFQSFSWLSDDRITYVSPGLNGDPGLWEIKVEPQTGKVTGAPRLTNKWLTADICSMTRSRDRKRMAFRRRTNRGDVYVGELDRTGRLGAPRRLTLEDSNNIPFAWTPDSRAVIFTSDRGGSSRIYKQALDQAIAEPLLTGEGNNYQPRITPDGRSILYSVDRVSGRGARLMQIPLQGGAPRRVLDSDDDFDTHCPQTPGHRCVLPTYLKNGQVAVILVDPVDGTIRELCRRSATKLAGATISPDGSEIAIMNSDFLTTEIELISLSGQPKEKIRVGGWSRLATLDYSADGKTFYAGQMGATGTTLLCIDRKGSAKPLWRNPGTNIVTWAIPSPNGQYLAFLASSSAENAWMIDER